MIQHENNQLTPKTVTKIVCKACGHPVEIEHDGMYAGCKCKGWVKDVEPVTKPFIVA